MPGTERNAPTDPSPGERREFYRIDDHIGLEIRRLDHAGSADTDVFDDSPQESLHAEFRRLDHDVKNQLVTLAERDRTLAGLLKSMNSKIDTLARIIAFEQNPLQPEDWQDVTLSEGGLSFTDSAGAWQKGDIMAIRMTLPPELYQPRAVAEVFDLEQPEPGQARIHTAFTHIDDGDRQQIARHVMRWQVRQRQNR
ncbi:MAG: PilZ domain-containing protein [Alteromonadaceae bacterium]|nr:PilZ domain-containing protein [Alteromonadaceae bacterium]